MGSPTSNHRSQPPQSNAQKSGQAETVPLEVYSGSHDGRAGIRLRVANGGAGQSGLIRALADAFIDYEVKNKNRQPFQIGWFLGDTTQSLEYLENQDVDIAITYREAAENQALKNGYAVERVYGFRDHFMLVGPYSNPAQLDSQTDDVLAMFNKITKLGRAYPPTVPATRFLSRFDKSATNIKESEIFVTIGQVPWALAYSNWYHQYPRFPVEALRAAALLEEYTLTDRGTYTVSNCDVQKALRAYLVGSDAADDLLLNPARVLRGRSPMDQELAVDFLQWMEDDDGGQDVIRNFKLNGVTLYTTAPKSSRTNSVSGARFM